MQDNSKNAELDLWLKANVSFQDREKCEKMGLEISEEGVIDIFLPDVNAMMLTEDSDNIFVFIHGIDLELIVDDRKALKKRWKQIKDQGYETKDKA